MLGNSLSMGCAVSKGAFLDKRLVQMPEAHQQFPSKLFDIVDAGNPQTPYWIPASRDGRTPNLEPGEQVLGKRVATVKDGSSGTEMGDLDLLVTDRRLLFATSQFDVGGGWWGLGGAAVVVAGVANVVSRRRAAARSAGKIAVGQIRYEWIAGILTRSVKALIGTSDFYIDILVQMEHGTHKVSLWRTSHVDDALADVIARLSARRQLDLGGELPPPAVSVLNSYLEGQRTEVSDIADVDPLGWTFPTDRSLLITAAKNNSETMEFRTYDHQEPGGE